MRPRQGYIAVAGPQHSKDTESLGHSTDLLGSGHSFTMTCLGSDHNITMTQQSNHNKADLLGWDHNILLSVREHSEVFTKTWFTQHRPVISQ